MKLLSALLGATYHHFDLVACLGSVAALVSVHPRFRGGRGPILRMLLVLWVGAFLASARRPHLLTADGRGSRRSAASLVKQCRTLRRTFWPNLLGGGLLHSLLCAVVRPLVLHPPQSTPEILTLEDGGSAKLVWVHGRAESAAAPVVVIFPGNLGGSDASYLLGLLQLLARRRWRAVVYHRRGCGQLPLTSPRPQDYTDTQDTPFVLRYIQRRFPRAPLLGCGFSLGGNHLVNTLAQQQGRRGPLRAAVVLGVPYDLNEVSRWLATDARLVELHLLSDVKDMFARNRDVFLTADVGVSEEQVMGAPTYRAVVEALHCKVFGRPDVDAYLREASSVHQLARVDVPLLCVHAEDDPVVPPDALPPAEVFRNNAKLALALTVTGGHHGFVGVTWSGPSWSDKVVVEWLDAALAATGGAAGGSGGGGLPRVRSF